MKPADLLGELCNTAVKKVPSRVAEILYAYIIFGNSWIPGIPTATKSQGDPTL